MRSSTIDIMRGFGIILVGLEHCTLKRFGYDACSTNPLYLSTISFLIHIFFAVSGYLVYDRVTKEKWLTPHITKWFIPMAIFGLLYWIIGFYFPQWINFEGLYGVNFTTYILHIVTSGFSGTVLWFIWTLMLCYLLGWFLEKGRLHIKVPLIIQAIVLIVIINLIPFDSYGFFTLKWYGIFFLTGYLIKHYQGHKVVKFVDKFSFLSIIIFPIVLYFNNWMIPYQKNFTVIGMALPRNAFLNGEYIPVIITLLVSLLGIAATYSISKMVKWKWLAKPLAYLGSITIGIYLIRVLFVGIVGNEWLALVISTVISVGLYELLRRNKFLDYILFGGEPIKLKSIGGWYGKGKV